MNNTDYNRLVKILRLKLLDETLISEIVGLMRVGRLSAYATRVGDWDYLMKSVNACINNIQSNRRSRTGVLLAITERALAQARAVRGAVSSAAMSGRDLSSFTSLEDDGATWRNTKVWWTWIPKAEREKLLADLAAYYTSCGAKRGKRFTPYRDREYERLLEQGTQSWRSRVAELHTRYATPETQKAMYPKSKTRKGAFMLGLARRIEREVQQRASLGQDIPQGLRTLLPSALYARTLEARAVPDDHAGLDAMLDIKGFEDFYAP